MRIQARLGIKQDPISKITRAKVAEGMAQVIACVASTSPDFKPQYHQKNNKKEFFLC
jgi:hypothetical protein